MTEDRKIINLNIPIPVELHQAAAAWAKDNESSIAGCVRLALRQFLQLSNPPRKEQDGERF